jgi:membrane-associated phospholipid phosphatase
VKSEERRGDAATRRRSDPKVTEALAAEPTSIRLNPADIVVIAYLAIVALLIVIFSRRIEYWAWLGAAHLVVIALVVLLARFGPSGSAVTASPRLRVSPSPPLRVLWFLRGWYPILLIGLTYKELTYLIPRIHPRDFDAMLAAIDYRMFGVNPTVWIERFTWPPLTEVLQLTYSTYYLLPVILGVVLWRKRWLDKYFFWVFVVMFGFYLSYLGYLAVPAIGPRFLPSIIEAQTKPLTGVWLFLPVRQMLDRAEGITRDCFPSGHTELTLLVLYYSHRFHRRTFWWFLPFGIGIILSTVYLRYHYVIDVVAGALVAAIVVVVAKPLFAVLGGRAPREA